MKKLQQFNVLAFTYERLANNNFKLKINCFEAERNEELIAVADNECLRAIRRLTNHAFNEVGEIKLNGLIERRKKLIRQKNSASNREHIKRINNEIRELLFIPEFISVTTVKKKRYPKIGRDGFYVNGLHYSRFSCSAGNARTNRTMFVCDTIFEDLVNILRCGCKDIPLVSAKYNAYFSLTSSATYQVSTPRVCVVKDCEVEREELVDWVNETEETDVQEIITREKRKLKFNLFDGMGLISPEFADVWSADLGLDYKSSAYCVRNAFIKGMVCVFDFKRFAGEVAKNNIITDLWGKEYDINDIDIILTESQFKLWNAYNSWQEYELNVEKSQIKWGVSKFAPSVAEEKHIMRSNYQFLQVLDLNDDEVKGLCQPTVDWLKNISGNCNVSMLLYLIGKRARDTNALKIWNNTQDSFVKSLILEPSLVEDNYIQDKIKMSIQKRIRESLIGKLLVNANFEVAISDPYALCEHLFGLEVKGLLNRDECFCKYWRDRGAEECAVLRSPLTWKSEVDILKMGTNALIGDWYKYLDSGVVLNVHGVDCNLLGGSDFDYDIFFITNNQYFIKGALNDKIPVCYQPKKAPKQEIKLNELYKTDVLGYGTEVGVKTNIGTTFYSLTDLYEKGSKEYDELRCRNKLCCYQQSAEIDSTKGIAKKPMPSFWTKYTKILSEDSAEEVTRKEFLNSLIADKRPYFMKYLYPHYKKDYNKFIYDFDLYSYAVFGFEFDKIPDELKDDERYKELVEYRNKKCTLIDSPCIMNRICHYMEKELKDIKRKNKNCDCELIFEKLYNNTIDIDFSKLELLIEKKKEYDDFKKTKQLSTSEFSTYEQYYKNLRNDCLEKVSSDIKELANLAVYICYKLNPSKPKNFCWDVFGCGIVENLKEKTTSVHVPCLNESGEVYYLGEHYTMEEVNLDGVLDDEISDIDSNRDDTYDLSNDDFDIFEDLE